MAEQQQVTPLMDPQPALAELDDMVEYVGLHEPLLAYPVGTDEEEPDWAGAFDALIAAKLVSPNG